MRNLVLAFSLLALAGTTGCVSVHAQIPEEAVRWHMAHEEGAELAAVCSHEGKTYSEGARVCMAGRQMSCDPTERWTQDGDC